MKKFIYNRQIGFKIIGYANHASIISNADYDYTIRGIIFNTEKIVYLRINDLTCYEGLKYKKITYKFDDNLALCRHYCKKNYQGYKVYTSYTIKNLDYQLQEEILQC